LLVLFGFRYRSAYYLLPLIPILALMVAELFARLHRFRGPILAALLVSVAVKTISAAPVWGIAAGRESHRAVAPALDRYCEQHRDNGLIIVGPDDQFYASTLPLAQLRYALLTPPSPAGAPRPWMDFDWLGISASAMEFDHLNAVRPIFRRRLAEFNLDSDEALATVIRIESLPGLARLIEGHPEVDFWVPRDLLPTLNVTIPHQVEFSASGVFLLARQSGGFHGGWPCHL